MFTVKEAGVEAEKIGVELDVRVNKNPRKNASTLDVYLLSAKVH